MTIDHPHSADKASDYIRTAAQNYISRSATVHGPQNLVINGRSVFRPGVVVHGDFDVLIHVGRYVRLDEGVVVKPCVVPRSSDPLLTTSNFDDKDDLRSLPPGTNERAIPVLIGSHTRVGHHTRISSVSVGSCVYIGSNCTLSPRSKVHDCVVIEDGTVVPPDMVVPPFSRVRGTPGRIVGILPECTGGELVEARVRDYLDFVAGLEGGD